jgi:PHD/YefM family antitoxin component YafN of YafNO toxin-antitoxin module
MIAKMFSEARNGFTDLCDMVNNNDETVIVARNNHKNVVIMAEHEYNNMLENLHVRKSPAMYQRILEGNRQIDQGKTVEFSGDHL